MEPSFVRSLARDIKTEHYHKNHLFTELNAAHCFTLLRICPNCFVRKLLPSTLSFGGANMAFHLKRIPPPPGNELADGVII